MHGGYGYIAEGGIERYLRDIRVNRILEGTNEIMKLIISRKILSEAKWKFYFYIKTIQKRFII